jgi:hypothetical protein
VAFERGFRRIVIVVSVLLQAIVFPGVQRTRVAELLAGVEGSTQMGDTEASPVRPSFMGLSNEPRCGAPEITS